MFLETCQTARESLTDDEAFLALELAVLDDFVSAYQQRDAQPLRNEHLQYLAALHLRGEDALGLQLIDRVLESLPDDLPTEIGAVPLAEVFILKASILVATGAPGQAENALRLAAETSTTPQMSGEIAVLLAGLLAGSAREAEALAVLRETHDSLAHGTKPAELVTSLAAAYAAAGDYEQAGEVLRGGIGEQAQGLRSTEPDASALCRVFLVSLLLEQGKYIETEDLLGPVHTSATAQPLIDLACYYSAVSAAASRGDLLSECLRATAFLSRPEVQGMPLPLFGAFGWIRPGGGSEDKIVRESKMCLGSGSAYLAGLFRSDELNLQGSAYQRLAEGDFAGAIDVFQNLEELRIETGRQGNLTAALDMRALAFAMVKAGRSGALDAARSARRRLQLLLGLSSEGTLRAVLDEALILMDLDESASAGVLVRQALTRKRCLDDGREVIIRLRLVLMEVHTRTGLAHESLQSVSALESEAMALQSTAPDLLPIVKYQAATAKTASGDFDAAEHEFEALRRSLDSAKDVNPELVFKATYGLARVMQRRGEYAHALSLLTPLSETSPQMSRPLSLRIRRRVAACHANLNEHSAAADVYRSCADDLSRWAGVRDPDYLDMRLLQADSLLASGQYKPSRRIYRSIWELLHKDYSGRDVFYIRAVIGNATCLRRLKDYSGAVLNYRRVRGLESRTQYMSREQGLDLEKWLAWSLEMTGALADAAKHYTEAIRLLDELQPERTDLLKDLRFRLLCCTG